MADFYEEVKARLEEDSEGEEVTHNQVVSEMKKMADHTIDLSKLTPQKHIWIPRGMKLTCENAGHPYHEAWVRKEIQTI